MFAADVYLKRRARLKKNLKTGILLFPGNEESAMNYPGNPYHYRQDSTFLYYWGLDEPGLVAVMDLDDDRETLFGYDFSIDDIVWMGPQPSLKSRAGKGGIRESVPVSQLGEYLNSARKKGRTIHFLPQYRPENMVKIQNFLGIQAQVVNDYVSLPFVKAVIAQRSLKAPEEIKEIEAALEISYEMQTYAMEYTKPGMVEREIAGAMEGIARSMGWGTSFPTIFSIHGETLHNHYHGNEMKKGDIVVNDSGAETVQHYSSDVTRTFPVSGKFSSRQKEIYQIVLNAQLGAIEAMKPDRKFREVHLLAARIIANGLKELGIMKGDMAEAVKVGAHALFFPHGLGHMMGLDVHDMENLGEEYVGYDNKTRRSDQFGLAYLRMAKELQPGHVMTIEPGIYFIPELINLWKKEKKFNSFIDYKTVDSYKNFGGIRIEDDVLVTRNGFRVLGKPIPKTISDVENVCG